MFYTENLECSALKFRSTRELPFLGFNAGSPSPEAEQPNAQKLSTLYRPTIIPNSH